MVLVVKAGEGVLEGEVFVKAGDANLNIHDSLETTNWKRCFVDDTDGKLIEVYERPRPMALSTSNESDGPLM